MGEKEERAAATWAAESDAHLVGYAARDPLTPQRAPTVEMQRRLKEAIKDFNEKSGRQATTMIRLTWAIVGLTVILGIIAGLQVWLMLKGGA